jgi:hypothetical protein
MSLDLKKLQRRGKKENNTKKNIIEVNKIILDLQNSMETLA